MKHRLTKVTVCAAAAAIVLCGSAYRTEAARGIAACLPAAGLGLTLEEGTSIARIREDVKQKKQVQQSAAKQQKEIQKELETQAPETETAALAGTLPEDAAETESAAQAWNGEPQVQQLSAVSANDPGASVPETEIVEAVEPAFKETEISEKADDEPELVIAQVNRYVNIRNTPGTDGEVVGKLYDNSVGTLVAEEGEWYEIKSGSVEGYVKAEYFKRGEEAKQIADEVGDKIATVTTQTLKVRTDPSLEASVLGLVPGGEELTVMETAEGFVKVSIEEGDGWVSTDYVDVETEYVTAESIEEEQKRLEAEEAAKEEAKKAAAAAEAKLREQEKKREEEKKAKEEAQKQEETQEQEAQETVSDSGQEESQAQEQETEAEASEFAESAKAEESIPTPKASSSLGQSVADYAVQFVGNPYVYGGTSLTNGADCSGFVMSVYKQFGVSLPHSSSADRHVGYKVNSMAEAQPGDIICYSGHVAIYIGNGQIVHASTRATGIKISDARYRTPLAIRRIF